MRRSLGKADLLISAAASASSSSGRSGADPSGPVGRSSVRRSVVLSVGVS